MDPGAELRQAREARQLTLEAVSRTTRIRPRLLAALERNDLTGVPSGPYARGFVRAYAAAVGLDADRLVREYFAQFDGAPHPVAESLPRVPYEDEAPTFQQGVLPVALLGVFAIAGVLLLRGADDAPPPPQIGAVGTSGQDIAVAPAVTSQPTLPASAPADREVAVVLTTAAPSWVEARADGEQVLYRLLPAGERHELRARRDLRLRVGDAGAVSLTVDGRDAGVLGRPGEVRDLTFSPRRARIP